MGICSSSKDKKISNEKVSTTKGTPNKRASIILPLPSIVYSLRKFGTVINPKADASRPLFFEYHFSNIKCRKLQENKYYLVKIFFDEKEFTLPLVTGTNPQLTFDEVIHKEVKFNEMEDKFMEIILFFLPDTYDIYQNYNREVLFSKAKLYASIKVDLLTIAIGPMNHDIVLLSPKKRNQFLGRISYTITCRHVDDVNITIKKTKVEINRLLQNQISLKAKFKNENKGTETKYTKGLVPQLINKEEKTRYECVTEGVLFIKTNISLYGLHNADASLNIYTFHLLDCSDNNEASAKNFLDQNIDLRADSNKNIKLINHYSMIGYATINFLNILSENEAEMRRQSSQFLRQLSGFNIEPKGNSNENGGQVMRKLTFDLFLNISREYTEPIFYKGVKVGECEISINMNNIPLIHQIMFGVMTENGFEINTIPLYDNVNDDTKLDTLPNEVNVLAKQKASLDNELIKQKQINIQANEDFNNALLKILKEIKESLSKSIEDNCLYYGYSNDCDLYTGQHLMLDLGITLIDVVNKLNTAQRTLIFNLLKLLNERSEFDLGTLSSKWFASKEEKGEKKVYFRDNTVIEKDIVQKFLEFNLKCLVFALGGVQRGKTLDAQSRSFCGFFMSVVYFRLPLFRKYLLEAIKQNITNPYTFDHQEKENKGAKKSIADYMEMDPVNSLILWEDLFYNKLDSALKNEGQSEAAGRIKDKLNDINKFIISSNPEHTRSDWKDKIAKKDLAFFTLVQNLNTYILNKVKTSNINWINIPGYTIILNGILFVIETKGVKEYPPQFMSLIPLFINDMTLINEFIKRMIFKTNVYDVLAVFNIVSIIDSLFVAFREKNQDTIFNKFDYNILSLAVKTIFEIDHSLSVAKFLWLYYKNAHLMSLSHLGETCESIFISKFYSLFFHWSWQVRNLFYHLVLYVIGFRLKKQLPYQDMEDMKLVRELNQGYTKEFTGQILKSFGDILEEKFSLIFKLEEIVKKEHSDPTFNNIINPEKYREMLKNIPVEAHKSIVVSLHHFEELYTEYKKWEKVNTSKRDREIEYPEIVLVTPKDDVVEYTAE